MLLNNGNRLEAKNGGRFDFDDGGVYVGEWEKGQAHGYAVATGPQHKGEYLGAWHYGFEVSGAYTWPTGNYFVGQWQNGRRHGLGTERRGRWVYRGEFNNGLRGRYGHRQSITSRANYLGTWTDGLHDGYGTETYVDGGFYSGSWSKGQRHGYGVRHSANHGIASKYRPRSVTNASLTSIRSQYDHDVLDAKHHRREEENEFAGRNGFVLKAFSGPQARRRRSLSERSLAVKRGLLSGFRIKKQHSTAGRYVDDDTNHMTALKSSVSGSLRSSGSTISCASDDYDHQHHHNLHDRLAPPEEVLADDVFETYKGEFKTDERGGYGICERSDGLKYVGEWNRNKKNGYGTTFFKDGTVEEGKYRDNILVLSAKKKGILFVRPSAKIKERVESATEAAERAAQIAQQKADIAASRTQTAEERAQQAVEVTAQAIADADNAYRACEIYMKPDEKGSQDILRRVTRACRMVRGHGEHAEHVVPFEHVLGAVGSYRVAEPHNQLDNPAMYGNDLGPGHQEAGPSRSISHQNSQDSQNLLDHPIVRGPVIFPQEDDVYAAQTAAAYHQAYGHPQHVQYSQQAPQLNVPNHNYHNHVQSHSDANYAGMPGSSRYDYAQQGSSQMEPRYEHSLASRVDHYSGGQSTSNQPGPSRLDHSQPPPPVLEEDAESEAAEEIVNPSRTRSFPLGNCVENVGASRMSVNDDHFDQYMLAANPQNRVLRRNRPSLTRQTEVNPFDNQTLNRRCTLASARDRQHDDLAESEHRDADRGSLPNLHDLGHTGLHITREDASRLASQRRQERQRLAEEDELLRSNPLRYLFRPSFVVMLHSARVFILLVVVNVLLLLLFFHLLFQRSSSAKKP